MIRTLRSFALAGALLAPAGPAVAQSIAYGEPPPSPHTDRLADHYRVRLTSAWPQLPSGSGCENGGAETVEGLLISTGRDDYSGTLTRRTHLLFCGAHGGHGDACTLVLDGKGEVIMRGAVVPDAASPSGRSLRVVWTPAVEHAASVTGACSAEFKEKVERMYLTVRHGAEFMLPNAGSAPRTERLDEYAWVVDVE